MSKSESFNIKSLANNYDHYVDNTEKIRELKHSTLIKYDINKLIKIKQENPKLSFNELNSLVEKECSFLFSNYKSLIVKLLKNEIDISILEKVVNCLKEIEDGKKDQNEASIKVGTILKELYIDNKVDNGHTLDNDSEKTTKKQAKNISWNQFKFSNN